MIVILGDLKVGNIMYLHYFPEMIAFSFFGSWLKEIKTKFYPLLLFFISFGIVYWSILHSGYLASLLLIYLLMFPLILGYCVPIITIER